MTRSKFGSQRGGPYNKLSQNIVFLYSKWPHRSHTLIKKKLSPQTCQGTEKFDKNLPKSHNQTKPPDFDGLLYISRPHYAFEGWFFFNHSVWSLRSFWIQKTYIVRQFFLGPPLRDPDFEPVTPQAYNDFFQFFSSNPVL